MAGQGLHLNIYRVPGTANVWRCDLKLNTSKHGEGITIRGTSEDDEDGGGMGAWWENVKGKLSKAGAALAKVRVIAKAVLSNPAIAQAFPQYVAPALATLEALEVAEKRGMLPALKGQFTDPTLRKLTRELDEMSRGQRAAMSGGGVCLCDGRAPKVRHVIEGAEAFNFLGAAFPAGGRPSPFGLSNGRGMPFGLPQGNPHPFAESIRRQIAKGVKDPLALKKLAAMHDYQRRMARNSR